jgi:hypothetical protein
LYNTIGEIPREPIFEAEEMDVAFRKFVRAMHHLNMETFTRDVMASGSPIQDGDQSDGAESIVTLDE